MAKAELSLREMIEAAPQGGHWLDGLSKALGQTNHEDLLKKLSSVTDDGLVIAPIYPLVCGREQLNVAPNVNKAWKTLTRIDHPSPTEANAQLLHDLEQGADGAVLVLNGSVSAHGFGIVLHDLHSFETLFDNVFVDATSLRIDGLDIKQSEIWADFCSARNYTQASLDVGMNSNDIESMIGDSSLIADASIWHNRGATAGQELGLALAEIVSLARALNTRGIDLNYASSHLNVTLSSDADQFESMAKFRAMRMLWRNVQQTLGIDESPLKLHATTSWRMMGRRDPWTNVLRATMATFAAGLGGADSVSVLPHTQALGLPDAFARRVARNIGLILQEECHLAKVNDPASGAGVYDELTVSLAEKAWTVFQSIEAQGGFTDAVCAGADEQLIAPSRKARLSSIARRKHVSLGNSHFANLEEPKVDVLTERPLESVDGQDQNVELRDDVMFEGLAERARKLSAHTEPAVSLLCFGNRKSYKARSDFASDLFAAGGMVVEKQEIDPDLHFGDLDIKRSPVICICGADADYEVSAAQLVSALREAGAQSILLAGQGEFSGLDDTIFIGCNAHAVLDRVLLILEGLKS